MLFVNIRNKGNKIGGIQIEQTITSFEISVEKFIRTFIIIILYL